MQDFSTMARQMQNIAAPGKMPMATMAGRGPIVSPGGGGMPPPMAPGGMPPPMAAPGGPPGSEQMMQMIQQIAQQIEAVTGVPATPEQIQAALSQLMPELGAGGAAPQPGIAPPAAGMQQAMPMVPPQLGMKR